MELNATRSELQEALSGLTPGRFRLLLRLLYRHQPDVPEETQPGAIVTLAVADWLARTAAMDPDDQIDVVLALHSRLCDFAWALGEGQAANSVPLAIIDGRYVVMPRFERTADDHRDTAYDVATGRWTGEGPSVVTAVTCDLVQLLTRLMEALHGRRTSRKEGRPATTAGQ